MGRDLYEAGYPLSAQPKEQSQPLWADESPWEAPSCRESTDALSLCTVLLRNQCIAGTSSRRQTAQAGEQADSVSSTTEGWAPFCSCLSLCLGCSVSCCWGGACASQLWRFTASLLLEGLCALDPNELPIHFPLRLRMAVSDWLLSTAYIMKHNICLYVIYARKHNKWHLPARPGMGIPSPMHVPPLEPGHVIIIQPKQK